MYFTALCCILYIGASTYLTTAVFNTLYYFWREVPGFSAYPALTAVYVSYQWWHFSRGFLSLETFPWEDQYKLNSVIFRSNWSKIKQTDGGIYPQVKTFSKTIIFLEKSMWTINDYLSLNTKGWLLACFLANIIIMALSWIWVVLVSNWPNISPLFVGWHWFF